MQTVVEGPDAGHGAETVTDGVQQCLHGGADENGPALVHEDEQLLAQQHAGGGELQGEHVTAHCCCCYAALCVGVHLIRKNSS